MSMRIQKLSGLCAPNLCSDTLLGMTYDVNKIRAHFPALNTGLAYFDGPGGSQVPDVVGAAIAAAITRPISNRNVNTESEKNAEALSCGDLLVGSPGRTRRAITERFVFALAPRIICKLRLTK